MKPALSICFLLLLGACGGMRLVRDETRGTLTVVDGEAPVLTYRFGDQLAAGAPADRVRSGYVHPIFGLDGEELTEDFPKDHLHHRGLSVMWPIVRVGEERCDLWHLHGIRTRFDRFLETRAGAEGATLRLRNHWTMADGRVVADETWTLVAHPRTGAGARQRRAIDVRIELAARDLPITLRGQVKKGYGGLNLRLPFQTRRKDSAITTDRGPVPQDLDHDRFAWADLSARFDARATTSGIAVLVPPDHPDFPPPWTLRYYGDLNVAWPGERDFVLRPGVPLVLEYRLLVHRGDARAADVAAAYAAWVASRSPNENPR